MSARRAAAVLASAFAAIDYAARWGAEGPPTGPRPARRMVARANQSTESNERVTTGTPRPARSAAPGRYPALHHFTVNIEVQ